MTTKVSEPSAREQELLDAAYQWVLAHGVADMSLRPLAEAIGSSPRVLLYLFGSKDGLIRALLEKARQSELNLLGGVRNSGRAGAGLAEVALQTWSWLSDGRHRPLLRLWVEAYSRSLTEPAGPWRGFAEGTVRDWLDLLAHAQPSAVRRTKRGLHQRTLVLAVLRGGMLDLLATDDRERVTVAVAAHLRQIAGEGRDAPGPP